MDSDPIFIPVSHDYGHPNVISLLDYDGYQTSEDLFSPDKEHAPDVVEKLSEWHTNNAAIGERIRNDPNRIIHSSNILSLFDIAKPS